MTSCCEPPQDILGQEDFRALADLIQQRGRGVPIDYFPSPGNWGDALINAGAERFFDTFDIDVVPRSRNYVESLDSSHRSQRTVVVGGGGGWNRNWNSTIGFVHRAAALYRDVIVLPSSYDPDLIEDLPRDNVVLVARGKQRSGQCADMFCHDMAFALDVTMSGEVRLPYPLIAFRRDKERNNLSINPDRNWDLSLLGDSSTDVSGFLKISSRFSEVWTDRLHIGIAAALQGARVHLFDGNYGKVQEVFNASIRGRFPNVSFHEWRDFDWEGVSGITPIGLSGYAEGDVQ